jgi:hypothetical protein
MFILLAFPGQTLLLPNMLNFSPALTDQGWQSNHSLNSFIRDFTYHGNNFNLKNTKGRIKLTYVPVEVPGLNQGESFSPFKNLHNLPASPLPPKKKGATDEP